MTPPLKRVFALFLLVLFMMNMLGLYGVFLGVQYQYAQEVAQNLDEDLYVDEDALTFKVPLTVPYHNDSRGYERVRGDFELNGQVYQLVKQKLHRDTLYIVCVKDHVTKKINQALTDYVKTWTDKPENTKSGTVPLPQFSKDFLSHQITVTGLAGGWEQAIVFAPVIASSTAPTAQLLSPPPQG